MSLETFWRRGAAPAALGSLGSLLSQAAMALFLLGLFEPAAVGLYSVVAQVSFGWATLALAQSPLSLLANQHLSALHAGRQAWRQSAQRWLWLTPLALLALGWSMPAAAGLEDHYAVMAWAAAMALAQLSWMLAQSLALRVHSPLSIAAVRVIPPLLAATGTALAAGIWHRQDSQTLLLAALTGYVAGALWLWPLWRPTTTDTAKATLARASSDTRSERLKFMHTFSDVVVALALASHWARLYGATEAGCLLILLRVMGFVPALVSTAWSQVVLSRPEAQRPPSWFAAGTASLGLCALAGVIFVSLQQGWLPSAWAHLRHYLLPVLLWQIAASTSAAVSHRPFRFQQAHAYTWSCLAINALQTLLVFGPSWWGGSQSQHLWLLTTGLALALGLQALWAARLKH
jgi:hypothetical protein